MKIVFGGIFISFFAFYILMMSACTVVKTTKEQYAARSRLEQKNIPYTSLSFMNAAKKGKLDVLKLFLEAGMDVDIHNNGTALTYAVMSDNLKAVEFLVKNGADVNEQCYWGSPLGIASYKDFHNIAKFLIENGADVNSVSVNGNSPLFDAVLITPDYQTVDLLLESGADPNFRQEHTGETPLTVAASKGYVEIVKALLKAGADIDYKDSGKLTALDWALLDNKLDVARVLIENGAIAKDSDMAKVPLAIALERKDFALGELLIEHGASVNGTYGEMPLIVWCAKMQKTDSVMFLIDHGANIYATDKEGSTALDYALQTKNSLLVNLLRSVTSESLEAQQKKKLEKPSK